MGFPPPAGPLPYDKTKLVMKYNRGALILERFNAGYKVMGSVCKRFGMKRNVLAGLVEIYLDEIGEGYNFELISLNRDIYAQWVKDPRAPRLELNEKGDAAVRAFIFAYRNRLDKVINVRKRQESQ